MTIFDRLLSAIKIGHTWARVPLPHLGQGANKPPTCAAFTNLSYRRSLHVMHKLEICLSCSPASCVLAPTPSDCGRLYCLSGARSGPGSQGRRKQTQPQKASSWNVDTDGNYHKCSSLHRSTTASSKQLTVLEPFALPTRCVRPAALAEEKPECKAQPVQASIPSTSNTISQSYLQA